MKDEKCEACTIAEELKSGGATKVYDRYYCTCNGKDRKWRFNILTVMLNTLVPISWLGFVASGLGLLMALALKDSLRTMDETASAIIGGMFGGGIVISFICIILVKLSVNLFPRSDYICYERPVRKNSCYSDDDTFSMTGNPEVTEEWKELKRLCYTTPFDY